MSVKGINQAVIIQFDMIIKADSWPQVLDDSLAQKDWGWHHRIDLDTLVDIMIDNLKPIYEAENEKKAEIKKKAACS
jgi:hypothetical protein